MGIMKFLHGEVENFLQAFDQGLDDMGFPPKATIMIYEYLIKDLQKRIAYLNQTGINFKDFRASSSWNYSTINWAILRLLKE